MDNFEGNSPNVYTGQKTVAPETTSPILADDKVRMKAEHLEASAGLSSQDSLIEVDEERVKKIKWKVDLRLSAVLALMYGVNQIDRSNLGNA